jgi:hypothetical protein
MAQLTYPTDMTNAFPGMLADSKQENDVLSRAWENATSQPHGTVIGVGTLPEEQADVLADAAGAILGVIVHTHAEEVGSDDQNLVDTNRMANVLRQGRIFVELEDAMAAGDAVFVRVAAGAGGTVLGAIRSDADTATAREATGIILLTGGGAGEMAVLEVQPGATLA